MAWTTPATWSVSELVTASKMNTHIRDNLNYLKGAAGTIAFDAGIAVTGAITATTTITAGTHNRGQGGSPGLWLDETDGGVKGLLAVLDSGSWIWQRRAASFGALEATLAVLDITSGWLGLGAATPQGRIHAYDTISGCLKYEYDGVDGTARTVIPNAAGDVVYGIMGLYAVRSSGGTTRGGTFTGAATTLLTPGSNQDLYNVGPGTDVLQIQVAANGAVTVQRTAGSLTYKVSLWLQWL